MSNDTRQVFVRWRPGTAPPSHENTVIGIWETTRVENVDEDGGGTPDNPGAANVIYLRPDERWFVAPGKQPCPGGAPDWWADPPRDLFRAAIPKWAFRWVYSGQQIRAAVARLYIRYCRLWTR